MLTSSIIARLIRNSLVVLLLSLLAPPTALADDPGFSPTLPPGARCCVGMAFFAGTVNKTFMFGGLNTSGISQHDTWQWDGTAWTQVNTGTSDPGPRSSTRMVYDPALGTQGMIVLFGGHNCNPYPTCPLVDDATWLFDPTMPANSKWTKCTPSCTNFARPSARTSEGLAYNFDTLDMLLFGGTTSQVNGETWHLKDFGQPDGIHWERLFPLTNPAARGTPELAFFNKPGNHQMIMFGGNLGPGDAPTNETWNWFGGDWHLLSPPANPGARFGHRMAYDDLTQTIVLFGAGKPSTMNDTWFWTGSTWTACGGSNGCSTTPPLARCCVGLAYDQVRQTIVLYAGAKDVAPQAYPDSWLWDATLSWRCVHNCGL
jgi:hypothetical protein